MPIQELTDKLKLSAFYIALIEQETQPAYSVYTSASFGQHVGAHSFSNVGAHSLSPSELHPVILIRSSDG